MAMYEYSTMLMMLAQPSSVLGSFGPSDGGAEHDLSPLLSRRARPFPSGAAKYIRDSECRVVDCLLVFVSGTALANGSIVLSKSTCIRQLCNRVYHCTALL